MDYKKKLYEEAFRILIEIQKLLLKARTAHEKHNENIPFTK